MADENPIVVVEPDPGHKYHGNIDILTAMKNLAVKCGKAESADVIEAQTVADVWHLMGANDEAVTIAECIDSMEQSDFGGGGEDPNPNKVTLIPKQEFTVADGLIIEGVNWPYFNTLRSFSGTPYGGGTMGLYMYSFTNLGSLPDLGSSSPKRITFTFDDEDISLPFYKFSGSSLMFGLFPDESSTIPIFTEECPIAVSVLPAGTLVVLLPNNSTHTILGGVITVERNGVVWNGIKWSSDAFAPDKVTDNVVVLLDNKLYSNDSNLFGSHAALRTDPDSIWLDYDEDMEGETLYYDFKQIMKTEGSLDAVVINGYNYDQFKHDLTNGTHTIEAYGYMQKFTTSDMRPVV